MKSEPQCQDCGQEMEFGFIPDASYTGAFQSCWHRGTAQDKRFLGLKVPAGMGKDVTLIKHDPRQMVAITAYRCTGCGLLKLYAESDGDD